MEYVEHANEILTEHGAVSGTRVYQQRHQARWRARKLIDLMLELRLYDRWELREHTDARRGGWMWTVEYIGR